MSDTTSDSTRKANNEQESPFRRQRLRTWQPMGAPISESEAEAPSPFSRDTPSTFFTGSGIFGGGAFSGGNPSIWQRPGVVQTKLTVNEPDDQYEQEAERVAERVMRMPMEPPSFPPPPPQATPVTPTLLSIARSRAQNQKPSRDRRGDWRDKGAIELPAHRLARPVTPSVTHTSPIQALLIAQAQAKQAKAVESRPSISPAIESRIQGMNGGGSPLPDSERNFFESRMGADFSGVRIHTDHNAVQTSRDIKARAFTTHNNIAFNLGEYQPGTTAGRHLLAHELTHTVQQGAAARVLQREPVKVMTAAKTLTPTIKQRSVLPTIQRGEAGVHQNIEMTAWGVQKPDTPENMTPEQRAAMQTYAGNWMRDFSQAFAPTIICAISQVPQRIGKADSIGEAGGEALITGLLRALASLEFGAEITKQLITGPNIGSYRPEEHMDNPAGMSKSDVLVRNTKAELVPADQVDTTSADQLLDGSAGLGPQVENPTLYNVSDEGLANHIYNTTEAVKDRFLTAFGAGSTPEGRMNFGAGLHGVEDYFSHSNFIEVALNIILREKPNEQPEALRGLPAKFNDRPVDTLFDESVIVKEQEQEQERQAITTGTFGSQDTQVSLAHLLLPKLPNLFTSIDQAIDQALLLLEQEGSTWAKIKAELSSEPAGQALSYLLDGMDKSGIELPVPVIDKFKLPDDLPDVLPDAIENLEGSWIPIAFHQEWSAPSQAISQYKQLYQDGKAIWEYREEIGKMLAALLKLPEWMINLFVAVQKIRQAIELLKKSWEEFVQEFKTEIKRHVRQYLFKTIEQLTGINVPAEKRQVLEEWMHAIHEGVEELTHQTSLETRLQDGGDLAKLSSQEKERRIPKGALPPSHSEISKDHPPHEKDPEHSVHGPEGGSIFFEIHQQLAIFAVRHLGALMEQAWQTTEPNAMLIDEQPRDMTPRQLEELNGEAGQASKRAKKLAKQEGRKFTQGDKSVPPEAASLLDAVDLYISHPADSNWWRDIVQQYVDKKPEVLDDIQTRNQTRSERK